MPEWESPYSQPVEGFSDPLTALESCWGLCWAGLVSSLVGLGGHWMFTSWGHLLLLMSNFLPNYYLREDHSYPP